MRKRGEVNQVRTSDASVFSFHRVCKILNWALEEGKNCEYFAVLPYSASLDNRYIPDDILEELLLQCLKLLICYTPIPAYSMGSVLLS